MDYRDNRQRWAESHQVVHFYAGQWCTFTPALTLEAVPSEIRSKIVLWMVRCYIGEPGGYGRGYTRPVFYSDVAALRIKDAFLKGRSIIEGDVEAASNDRLVKAAVTTKHIARRFETLRDLVSTEMAIP